MLPQPQDAIGESYDAWPVVARLNAGWRVIACRDGVQWILQARHGAEKPAGASWRGRSYCQTSEALIRCAREHAGEIEPTAGAILAALPLRLGKPMTGVDAND